jgi:hypothetical protein
MNEATEEITQVNVNVTAIALDETRHYTIAEADKPLIKAIKSVYIYNRDERVHCCELTPSYWLEYLYTFIEWTDYPDDDYKREEIQSRYCDEPTDGCYMHCSAVKRMTETKDCGEYETFEEAREHLQGNCPI